MKKLIPALFLLLACSTNERVPSSQDVPEWSKSAIYYQIFVERFRNGDPTNDPTPDDMRMTYPDTIPASWTISDWTADWYAPDAYHAQLPSDMDFNTRVQLRRYGGDLQGVLDKIDYIADLGVNAIYFNPLNDAPSLHKYDPRAYHHIDRNFGPDPRGDVQMMAQENPIDPATWQWTAADKQFLEVIKAFHTRGIRVILDYSFNHTGYDFWAINDIRQNGENSKYTDWYEVKQYDNPTTPVNETEIKGWWGFKYLPLFQEKLDSPDTKPPHEGNIISPSLKQHIFDVSRRWLDPNGDGKFDDGVDGYRLDVAAEVSMGFWREYRQFVKGINPEAVLIGEVWWFDWPDLSGPEKMVQGDAFDGLMNYRWYLGARGFFSQGDPVMKPSEFVSHWETINATITKENRQAMMNIAGTHDTPRLSTCFFNDERYKEKAKPVENPTYKIHRPDDQTWQEVRMFLLHQYSFVGSPQIWNGDELGMWGADDPDDRKPIWWPEMTFQPEAAHPVSKRTISPDAVKADLDLLDYYKRLINIRKENPVLATGQLEFLLADDTRMCLAYSRKDAQDEIIAVFNRSDAAQLLDIQVAGSKYIDLISGEELRAVDEKMTVLLTSTQGKLLKRIK